MKILAGCAVAIGFVLLVLLFNLPDSEHVGPKHFIKVQPKLQDILNQAQHFTVEPGTRIGTRMDKGKLIRVRSSVDAFLIRNEDGRYFVIVDLGGGFLGTQGYIYSEAPNVNITNIAHMPLEESYHLAQLNDHWWSYDGKED